MVVNKKGKQAEIEEYDDHGWAGIHHAAYNGLHKMVERLIEAKPSRIELPTLDKQQVTPLWISFSQGQIDTVHTLLKLQADATKTDVSNRGVVEIALENQQIRLLEHLLKKERHFKNQIWNELMKYYTPEVLENCSNGSALLTGAATMIHRLSTENRCLQKLHEQDVLSKLNKLYKPEIIWNSKELEVCFAQTIFNLINNKGLNYKKAGKLVEVLTNRLISDNPSAHPVILQILQKLAMEEKFSIYMMTAKLFPIILQFLQATEEEVKIAEALIIIERSTDHCTKLQEHWNDINDFLSQMVSYLAHSYENIVVLAMQILCHYARNNTKNQINLSNARIADSCKTLLETKNKRVSKEVCQLISVTTINNQETQAYYIANQLIDCMIEMLNHHKDDMMYENIMAALCSIAGTDHAQRILVAKRVTTARVIHFAKSNSSKALQCYGFRLLQVLMRLCHTDEKEIKNSGILSTLVNILKMPTVTDDTLTSVLKTLRELCINRGYQPDKSKQTAVFEKAGLQMLAKIQNRTEKEEVQLETLHTIVGITMCQPLKWSLVKDEINFSPAYIRSFLNKNNADVQFKILQILALLCLQNSTEKEELNKQLKVPFSILEQFITSKEETHQIGAAFQLISLSEIILGSSPSDMATIGINMLIKSLKSKNNDIKAQSLDYISGTSRFCPGVKAAFVAVGLLDTLCEMLFIDDEMVKAAAAVAIVTLSQCLQGEIALLGHCRKNQNIYSEAVACSKSVRFSAHFLYRWKHFKTLKPGNC